MDMNSKSGRFILLLAVSFVFVMFGSRFVTLRFGQVFPEQSAADRNRIVALEARIRSLEARSHELDTANARLSIMEEENKRLAGEVEAVKNVKPIVIYQKPAIPAKPITESRIAADPPAVSPQAADASNVVHRGDTREKVRHVFGRPKSVNVYSFMEIWNYGNGTITFKGDGVDSWDDMPVEP